MASKSERLSQTSRITMVLLINDAAPEFIAGSVRFKVEVRLVGKREIPFLKVRCVVVPSVFRRFDT
jgi:hypothetical protein